MAVGSRCALFSRCFSLIRWLPVTTPLTQQGQLTFNDSTNCRTDPFLPGISLSLSPSQSLKTIGWWWLSRSVSVTLYWSFFFYIVFVFNFSIRSCDAVGRSGDACLYLDIARSHHSRRLFIYHLYSLVGIYTRTYVRPLVCLGTLLSENWEIIFSRDAYLRMQSCLMLAPTGFVFFFPSYLSFLLKFFKWGEIDKQCT